MSEGFLVSIGVLASSSAEELPETAVQVKEILLDSVANDSAVVPFCLHDRQTGSNVFITIL